MRSARCERRSLAIASQVLVLSLTWSAHVAAAWELLQGQGEPPLESVQVFFSAANVRLLDVDDISYRFEVSAFFHLTWTDDRAPGLRNASTEKWKQTGECDRPCSQAHSFRGGCCDDVWLPHLRVDNLINLPEGFAPQETIRIYDNGDVAWQVYAVGTFFVALRFEAHPFDHQHLSVRFSTAEEPLLLLPRLRPSSVSNNLLSGTVMGTEQVKGWDVVSTTIEVAVKPMASPFMKASEPDRDDPVPWRPPQDHPAKATVWHVPELFHEPHNITYTNLPLYTSHVQVTIHVNRYYLFYVVNSIITICFTVYLAFTVFRVDIRNLEMRLGTVITLLLALTAIMLVVTTYIPDSSHLLPIQVHALVSYIALVGIALESLVAYTLVTYHRDLEVYKKRRLAVGHYKQRRLEMRRSSQGGKTHLDTANLQERVSSSGRRLYARGDNGSSERSSVFGDASAAAEAALPTPRAGRRLSMSGVPHGSSCREEAAAGVGEAARRMQKRVSFPGGMVEKAAAKAGDVMAPSGVSVESAVLQLPHPPRTAEPPARSKSAEALHIGSHAVSEKTPAADARADESGTHPFQPDDSCMGKDSCCGGPEGEEEEEGGGDGLPTERRSRVNGPGLIGVVSGSRSRRHSGTDHGSGNSRSGWGARVLRKGISIARSHSRSESYVKRGNLVVVDMAYKLDFWVGFVATFVVYNLAVIIVYLVAGNERLSLEHHANEVSELEQVVCNDPGAFWWSPEECTEWVIGTPCCNITT